MSESGSSVPDGGAPVAEVGARAVGRCRAAARLSEFCGLAFTAAVSLSLSACGDGDGGTRFGGTDEVQAYRDSVDPVIDEVSAIEAEVQERAVGSSNAATAANLNAVYLEVRPQLLEVLVAFDRIQPPRRLDALHDDIRRLILLRLDAYGLVMEGFSSQDEDLYPLAEGKLQDANGLIPLINAQLCEVDVALGSRDNCRLLA